MQDREEDKGDNSKRTNGEQRNYQWGENFFRY